MGSDEVPLTHGGLLINSPRLWLGASSTFAIPLLSLHSSKRALLTIPYPSNGYSTCPNHLHITKYTPTFTQDSNCVRVLTVKLQTLSEIAH